MERVAQILIFIDKQDGEAGPKRVANPTVLLDHSESDERHVIEVD